MGTDGGGNEFRGISLDQYNNTAISMVNSLCCIQFTLFPTPQIYFTASANGARPLIKANEKNYGGKEKEGRQEEQGEKAGSGVGAENKFKTG